MRLSRALQNKTLKPDEAVAEEKFPYFPAFVKVANRKVVVIGGGEAAAGKLRLLCRTEARITVIASNLCADIRQMRDTGLITHEGRPFTPGMLDGAVMVFDGGGDDFVTQEVEAAAKARNIPVNVVDQTDRCDFITPAILDRAPVMVAICTGGSAPALARILRQRLEAAIPTSVGPLAAMARSARGMVASLLPDGRIRNRFWTYFFTDWGRGARPESSDTPREVVLAAMRDFVDREKDPSSGPRRIDICETDPMRLPYGVIRAIETAEIIYFDPRIPKEILGFARRDATLQELTCCSHLAHGDQIGALDTCEMQALYLTWTIR
ncbi:precorrin-2 dehydrogenase/sirohydrochlorin ferrochelatase family protein [Aestuariispira ectoiniformans]|uniref:precorrin-2 dehydrogenase/sirohydrochlorin ferrochelatase family protein n=1 Tax=Aestuariispira ectoiniformans TaxID=2775080 RepID=UPI00223C2A92|nr:bifunctional precorrin-2 dehydrogenase/sirohydrochlorin ferrochelatase [Aestuariispira ectoiniformans]